MWPNTSLIITWLCTIFLNEFINNRVKYCILHVTQNSNQYLTHHYMDLHDFLMWAKNTA